MSNLLQYTISFYSVKYGLSIDTSNVCQIISVMKTKTMIHYLENKVGVVDFANAQGMVMF